MEFRDHVIFDWYDGIVSAVVRIEGSESWFYCSLLFFDLASDRRLFALLPLSEHDEDLGQLLAIGAQDPEGLIDKTSNWKKIRASEKGIISKADGPVILLIEDSKENLEFSRKEYPIEECRKWLGRGVERAVSPSAAKRWSHFLDASYLHLTP